MSPPPVESDAGYESSGDEIPGDEMSKFLSCGSPWVKRPADEQDENEYYREFDIATLDIPAQPGNTPFHKMVDEHSADRKAAVRALLMTLAERRERDALEGRD